MSGIELLMKCGWSREEAEKRASQGFKGRKVGKTLADINEEKYGSGDDDIETSAYEGACKDANRMAMAFGHADFGMVQGCEWESHTTIGG